MTHKETVEKIAIDGWQQVDKLSQALLSGSAKTIHAAGLTGSAAAVVTSQLWRKLPSAVIVIMNDADEAAYFYNDAALLAGRNDVFFFPSLYRKGYKIGDVDAANEVMRTSVLLRLNELCSHGVESNPLIVTYPEALGEKVMSRRQASELSVRVVKGSDIDYTAFGQRLRAIGLVETDYVYEPGQWSARGSIIDVFPFGSPLPVRIDFFGDTVDSIRTFDVQSQLSEAWLDSVNIIGSLGNRPADMVPLTRYLPKATVVVAKDFGYVYESLEALPDDGRVRGDILRSELAPMMKVSLGTPQASARRGQSATSDTSVIPFDTSPQPLVHKNFDLLAKEMKEYRKRGYRLFILSDNDKQRQRLEEILRSGQFKCREGQSQEGETKVEDIGWVDIGLHEGWTDNRRKACFWTERQIFDRYKRVHLQGETARRGKAALTLKELREMHVGDYIVHIDMGIGRFGGLVRVPLSTPHTSSSDRNRDEEHKKSHNEGEYQEVVRIIYANNDKVDVSIHSLYKISKYKGKDTDAPPVLSTLGTGAWDRLKQRTKKRVKDIARDLIKLYAERRKAKGFAFSSDTYMQHELEASFIYEDTPDQTKATIDVKKDMESSAPMDRLVCGDVGFGKTEVAIRAAFKAACDSKQTAVLVPTTVLALQHYHTFSERLKEMPVKVEYLTRARGTKKTREILDGIADGSIDIVIGTHKLTGKGVKWHDLGLLIIDEEQKFGVSTKEKLRKIRTSVDTLTMSATPIPRTLQFSLMGARDMSVITTPPANRYPITTEVHEFSADIIAEAISSEMARGGQVFFVSNRINGLPALAAMIQRRVPGARVAIGHGQMRAEDLERIIIGFINYEYDILLSTTIVENGIDIPNANTIIINDAQRFGLADLHQMRGRVGRSNKKAYCYLLVPSKAVLTAEARRRLEAVETFASLGSGFQLSMQDLDIRGAGNLLGAEQSGFMEEMGYETYQKILSQAVKELKRDEFSDVFTPQEASRAHDGAGYWADDCVIDSDLPMYFPELYVPTSSERLLLYKELDRITDDATLDKYKAMLRDRFGQLPHEAEELLQVVPLRAFGKHLGMERIILKQGEMRLYMPADATSGYYKSEVFGAVIDYVCRNPRRCNMAEKKGKRFAVIKDVPSVGAAVAVLREMDNK